MAKPNLTLARARELFRYDPASGDLIRKISVGGGTRAGQVAGSVDSNGYVLVMADMKLYKAHRLIWFIVHGEWPKHQIDHINGVRTDNRLANLRDVSPSMNMQNQRRGKGTTGYLGVSRNGKRFMARIQVGDRMVFIGAFSTPEAAHEAYLARKREVHPACSI